MLLLKQLLAFKTNPFSSENEHQRKSHLIRAVSFELFFLNIFLSILGFFFDLTLISSLLLINALIVLFNAKLLKNHNHLRLCGHIINILCLIMITASNLWLGGASTSTLDWFYISPIIATVTIGLEGLFIYGTLSGLMLLTLLSGAISPVHLVSLHTLTIISSVNPIFIFILVCTILYHLLIENKLYESLLKEQNFLLSADKKKLHYLSHHDFLTSLPNRTYFHSHLQELMQTVKADNSAVTLFFMDLDGFKKINDRYGHEIGDALLLQVSKRLHACFRDSDFLARLGGDEFTAVAKHTLHDDLALVVTTRIKKEFKNPFLIKGLQLKCSISIGKANYPTDGQTLEALLKIADESMYKNKKRRQATTA
jgi:diguanylate cyclase (GGDEF)-like protein